MQCWSTQILDLTQYSSSCHNVDHSHQIKMVVSALSLLIISLFYVKLIFQAWSLTLKAIILVVDGVLVRYLFREASWICGTWEPWKAWAGQEELVERCSGDMRSCKQVKRCGFARRLLPFTEWRVWCCGPMLNAMTSIKTLEDRRVYLYDFLLLLSCILCLLNHCHGLSLSLVWLIFCLVNLVLV